MTILHIGPSPRQVGGMETFIGDLFNSSLATKYKLILLDLAKPQVRRFGRSAYLTGYSIFQRPLILTVLSYVYSLSFMVRFLGMLCCKRIDIIHLHTASYTSFWEKCFYIIIGKLAGKKIVLHIHGALFKEFYVEGSARSQKLIRSHLKRCDAIIVLSNNWKSFFNRIVDERKLFIVQNGIDISPFKPVTPKSDVVSFLHMGEVSQRKGMHDIIHVIEMLKQENVPVHFDIVGPGDIDKAACLLRDKNMAEYVTLHGPRYGAARFVYFHRAHCFILASYAEGFPIAMIEALAAGLPIVSTNVGGIPDMIQHGVHGFLCRPGDIGALATCIKKVVFEKTLREKMAARNKAYALAHFDIHKCAAQIATLYRQLSVRISC